MKFKIPIWNGVKAKKFKQKIATLELRQVNNITF